MPNATHSDSRHFTLKELQMAAEAAGITPVAAANNIVDTVADLVAGQPAPDQHNRPEEP